MSRFDPTSVSRCTPTEDHSVQRRVNKPLKKTAFALATCVGMQHAGGAHAQAANLVVHTGAGFVQGISTGDTDEFLGIPYAAPPVGALRWAPPQPAKWSGVFQADKTQSACPQTGSATGPASTDEDCLYLNVYAPRASVRDLPVMLWVHGGSDESGTGASYDGATLAQSGVMVVTINYRLGYLGFLAHPALDAQSIDQASGDYGLMDQQAALRWVKTNIAAFGGDSGTVTVFGESSGAQNILDHLVSPSAAGLFRGAIVESGGFGVSLPTLADADAEGIAFAQSVGCSSQTDASCLRNLPVSTILAQQRPSSITGSIVHFVPFMPNVGTAILPVQPLAAIVAGAFNRVPVLQGSNHDEDRAFTAEDYDFEGDPLTEPDYDQVITVLVGATLMPAVAQRYPLGQYASTDVAYAALATDAAFSCSARAYDEALARSVPVYNYEFDDDTAARFLFPIDPYMHLGAAHTTELPFLWPNLIAGGARPNATMTPGEQSLALQMQAAWSNFARFGDPNGPGVTFWPPYETATDQFHELVPGRSYANATFSLDHDCGFWDPILAAEIALPPNAF